MNHTNLERVDSAPLVYEEEIESKKQKTVAIIKEKIYLFGVNFRVKEDGLMFSLLRVQIMRSMWKYCLYIGLYSDDSTRSIFQDFSPSFQIFFV